jgi:hypothetical protein
MDEGYRFSNNPDDPDAWIVEDLTRRLGAGLTALLALVGAAAVAWTVGRYLDVFAEGGSALRAVVALALCMGLAIWMMWSRAGRYWFLVLPVLFVIATARFLSVIRLP